MMTSGGDVRVGDRVRKAGPAPDAKRGTVVAVDPPERGGARKVRVAWDDRPGGVGACSYGSVVPDGRAERRAS